jgi:hypothetical protein
MSQAMSRCVSRRWLPCGLALAMALAFLAGRAVSQEPPGKKESASAQPETDDGMKKMMEASAPGPHHKLLSPLAGQWDASVKFWMSPDSEPQQNKGSCKRKWILDGRFLTEEYEGSFMDQPFYGFGLTGYDNVSKKYANTWCDSLGTGMMISEGTCDASGKVFSYTGTMNCPMTGKPKSQRYATRILGESKHVFEMFDTGPDGKEFKSLEITYTRR